MDGKDIIIMYIQDDEANARIEYEPYHIWLNGNYIGCDFAKKYGFSKSDGKKPMNFIRKEKPKIDFRFRLAVRLHWGLSFGYLQEYPSSRFFDG